MFRCQFSGEKSEGSVYRTEVVNEKLEDGRWVSKSRRTFVSGPEKPIKIVIETRPKSYVNRKYNEDGIGWVEVETFGTEIVRELTVRPRHVDAVKARYGVK
jgi:hypothetical protein